MVAPQNSPLTSTRPAMPPAAGGSINGMKVLMGILLFVILVGVIMGVVVALSSGQPNIAFIIGLVGAAFFARVGC
jgi:hypothetical protein